MGDIAEMTLDGTLCSLCGVYLGLDTGYPVQCKACRRELKGVYAPRPKKKKDNAKIYRR